ncbi:MAG: hypothetical protein HY720_21600 [Planctomycetes bacterium]|nr:hypothetical protein [Planctomycetota bacterium]
MSKKETSLMGGPAPFPPTSWTIIRHGQDSRAPAYRESIEALYKKYWGPVYFYIRRNWKHDVETSKDLTQSFFVAFFEKGFLKGVGADKGRFRNFVCAALRNFLAKEKRAARAEKRSPREGLVSLDDMGIEGDRFDLPAGDEDDPERRFVEDWKRAIVEAAIEELRSRGRKVGKDVAVEAFVAYDLDRAPGEKITYEDLARRLHVPVTHVTNGLHWARGEFRDAFRAELRELVSSEEELRAEALELFGMKL